MNNESGNGDLHIERIDRILAVKDLPTLPKVLEDVSKLVDDPDSSTEEIAKLISLDQVLSAKVLRMVNSPIYGFPGRISSIQHALVLLGFNVIRSLVISTSVLDILSTTMVGLWEHSLGCALACQELAKAAGLEAPEEYSVAGLLHDLGKVVAVVQLPETKEPIDAAVKERDITYLDAEREVLGVGHDRINSWLARNWRLPAKVKDGMVYHHKPQSAEHYPAVACVVHVGNFLARLFEYGSGGDDNVPYLDPEAMKVLKMDFRTLAEVMDILSEKFVETSGLEFV